jgi:hypothetical protein
MSEEEMIQRQHDKMWRDLYLGDGRDDPPMTVRMAAMETAQQTYQHYARWTLGLMAGLTSSVVGGFIIYLITHK